MRKWICGEPEITTMTTGQWSQKAAVRHEGRWYDTLRHLLPHRKVEYANERVSLLSARVLPTCMTQINPRMALLNCPLPSPTPPKDGDGDNCCQYYRCDHSTLVGADLVRDLMRKPIRWCIVLLCRGSASSLHLIGECCQTGL
mmetsp:Transcript_36483/g.96258  ORF Transcript_36483/g.96258 Transcript_36483/m.96258 type:complete len:143 (+) Transcript_36483:187-615(+)